MFNRSRNLAVVYSFSVLSCLTGCAGYSKPVPSLADGPGVLLEYASFNNPAEGVAVSQGGRIFVSFPRWDKELLYSVAEVQADGSLRPYPNQDWNIRGGEGSPDTHFIAAQSLFVDVNDVLWVLDAPGPFSQDPQSKGAKLVSIDLASDRIKTVVPLDTAVVPPGSYLRKICVDQWVSHAYVSDAGTGALVVTDLDSGLSRRVLADDPSTKAEPGVVLPVGGKEPRDDRGKPAQFHVNGLALDRESVNLYYHALTAHALYRIQTRYLNDPGLSVEGVRKHVERLADTGAVDGMVMDSNYNLYLTALEDHAIKKYRITDDSLATVVQDGNISWLDGICTSPGNLLYVTASQFGRLPLFNNGKDERIPPYRLYRVIPLGP